MPATPFHFGVSLRGIHFEDSHLTVNLASGITDADIGKAVTLDTGAANKVKLAGDDDIVIGRLVVVENREVEGQLIGTVEFRFCNTLPIDTGETVVVGDTVVGSTAGTVKAATTPDYRYNMVVEVIGDLAVVVKLS